MEGTMDISEEDLEDLLTDTKPLEEETSDFFGFEDVIVQEKNYSADTNNDCYTTFKPLPRISKDTVHNGEEFAIPPEKETSIVPESEVISETQRNMSMIEQSKEKENVIPMEKETSLVPESEVTSDFQRNISINEQNKELNMIPMERETFIDLESEVMSESQTNMSMNDENTVPATRKSAWEPSSPPVSRIHRALAIIMEKENSEPKVNNISQENTSMNEQNNEEISIIMEKISVPESKADGRCQTNISMVEQHIGIEMATPIENENTLLSGSEMDMSMDDENKENEEENFITLQVCHFFNRDINGCKMTADECNWLHICACCNDDHPVKDCIMQREKEKLKKKLFRRGRRGGRTACEKRDIDICYYYNRNLNGCSDETCKLSHECFCCGESHPIIACDHIEIKKTYKEKCYHFNRGLLGCREKKCEKIHCCFACAEGHPIKSCSKKEKMKVAAVDGKSDNKKPAQAFDIPSAQAFDIPYNYSATAISHENDGPLCYAFNEGPNGCTEPEGSCKSVHACYTCGENHPISSCKQTPIKSTNKITKRKGKTKPEKTLEKIAKKIEEKQEIAKKISEKKELAILKIEEKIKLKKATLAPKHPIITLNPTTQKEDKEKKNAVTKHKAEKELTKDVTKRKPISPPRSSKKNINITRKICMFFNSTGTGCRNSTNCPFFHGCSKCKGSHRVDKCTSKRNQKVEFCSYFNNYFNKDGSNGCRNIDHCPYIHACYYCGDDHPGVWCNTNNDSQKSKTSKNVTEEKQLAKKVPSKEDYCYYFNNNHNGCDKSKDICPFIHACSSCGAKHPAIDCDHEKAHEKAPNKSSVHHRKYDEISVTIKSYKGSNVKKLSSSSSHEQYERRYPSEEYKDSLMEHSGLLPLISAADAEYQHYGNYRSRLSEHFEEEAYTSQPSRARSREREISMEREHLVLRRSDSRERKLSRERELIRRKYYSGEGKLSPERDQMRHHSSEIRKRHRSGSRESRERLALHTRMLARELRSRSRERYRPHSRERSISSAEAERICVERMIAYETQKSKSERTTLSDPREKRSRSREKDSGVSSSTDHNSLSRSQKRFARESSEYHTKNEGSSSSNYPSHGSTSSKMSSFDAMETCIILSNFCSDLGLLGPTLEEVCKRALADKDNIASFFKDPEVQETMELVSQKLVKLKSKSSNELHKVKYDMGIAKIEKLLEAEM